LTRRGHDIERREDRNHEAEADPGSREWQDACASLFDPFLQWKLTLNARPDTILVTNRDENAERFLAERHEAWYPGGGTRVAAPRSDLDLGVLSTDGKP